MTAPPPTDHPLHRANLGIGEPLSRLPGMSGGDGAWGRVKCFFGSHDWVVVRRYCMTAFDAAWFGDVDAKCCRCGKETRRWSKPRKGGA